VTVTQLPRALPKRDGETRAGLRALDVRLRPTALATDRRFAVPGPLGALLPHVPRGAVVTVDGASGCTSTALALAFAVVKAGDWAVALDDGTLGGLALGEHGLGERFAVVRDAPPARWASVVAALLDGVSGVLAPVPPHLRLGDARRLVARTRERDGLLVILGPWPSEAALRLHVERSEWSGLGSGDGMLGERALRIRIEGRGVHQRSVVASVG
jgi:hypothetical protein